VIIQHFILLFQKIQVDFEGRNPVDADCHGIKQLLQQLFLKAHINLSELADLIIAQNYVGSVVKVHSNRGVICRQFCLHISVCIDMLCFKA
jgi:hypothetical protein